MMRTVKLDSGDLLKVGKLLGKGMFTKCLEAGVSGFVILETIDGLKEVCVWCEGLHVPALQWLGQTDTHTYYQSLKYDKLTKKQWSSAWADYIAIKRYVYGLKSRYVCDIDTDEIEELQISQELKNDLMHMISWAQNYGENVFIEVSPRNLAVHNGNLILLDLFADCSK
jgi:hypothetical protein